jgi:hypothetical protein
MVDLVKAMKTSAATGVSLNVAIKQQTTAPVVTTVAKTTTVAPTVTTTKVTTPTVTTPVAKTTTTTPLLTLLKTGMIPTIESKEVLDKAAEAPKVYTQAGAISWAKGQLAKEAAAAATTTVATPIVTTPVATTPITTAPVVTKEPEPKVLQTVTVGGRTFDIVEEPDIFQSSQHYVSVYEGGKPVKDIGWSVNVSRALNVVNQYLGITSAPKEIKYTAENKDYLLTSPYFDTTKIPVSADTLSKYEKYLPTDKDVPLVIQAPPREGTTGTPESLGATVVIPGQKPTDIQKEFIAKTETVRDPEAPYKANYYAGVDEKGEPIFLHESLYQIDHDYNPATQDTSQQQLYSQLESEFGSNEEIASKNIELATEASKNISVAEDYLHQLNFAIEDVNKAGEYDDIFLVENGVEVKYKRDEALNKLSSQLEVRQEYLDWKAGKIEKMSDDNLTAAEYLDWSKTTSEKLPEYQTELNTISNKKLLISKYKKLGYKINVTDEGYSFELPTATEVYKWKHGEWTPAALSAANLMESPLGIKSLGAMFQEVYTGDEAADTKVREARMEELSKFALGLDKSIKEGDYVSHVITSPAMVEGVFLPLITLGATSLISKGLNVAAPRIVSGLGNVGSKFTPTGQAVIGKLTTGAKTIAEPFVTVGKSVISVGSKLPSTELTRMVSGQALNWGAFGVMEGGKLVEVAVKEPEKFGGVLAESAFTWGLVTGAMGEGMKSLDIKMPEFKSTPAMAELKEAGAARMEVFARKFDYNIAAPVKNVFGDVKYAIKTELKIPEIKAGLADIKAVARREIYSTIPIQETRADIRAAGAKFTKFGEKVSEKVEVPIAKFKKAGAKFKAEIKDTFYEKVPLTRDVKAKVESFKFKEAEPPTTEFVPSAVKTKQATVEPFGKQYKVIETKPKVFEAIKKPKEVIKYPAEGKNLEGTRPFGEKIEFKSKTIVEKPKRISHEPSEAKVESWRDLGRLTTKEKPVVKQDVLYPVPKIEVLKMDVDVGARTAKLKPSKMGEVEFKAPENRPRTIEEVNERMRLRQEADIKKGVEVKPTKQKVFSNEFTGAGKRPSYLLEVERGEVKITRLEDVGKDITGKGKTPLKFKKEGFIKDEKGTASLVSVQKAKVEVKAKPYEPVVLKEAEETVAKVGFDTSYLYRTVPAKYLVDIEQGIGGSSDYWTGRKPEVDREFGRNIRVGVVPIVVTEQKLGTELEFERISPEITETEEKSKYDILKVGITEQAGGTVLEQRLGLDVGSVLEQQLEQRLMLESRTILDVSPTTGRLSGKPFIPILIPRKRRTGQDEEDVVFGKKKKKKAVSKTRPGRKEILADIVSVMRSQARYGKATHPKMSKKVYEEAARTGFRHVPTLELKTKQYTPRVKSNGLRLDSSKLMVGNLKMKVNKKRGKRNAPRNKRWI